MANKNIYLSNPNNSFFAVDDDDVDDDTFLKSSRTHHSSYSASNDVNRERDLLDERHQQLIDRRKEIEERTIQSSQRSLGLLRESEQIGVETAQELLHQREQLERTEKRLDEINATLRFSQKHIQGIKSVFGSFKNYLSGKSGEQPPLSGKVSSEVPSSSSVSTSSPLENTLTKSQSGYGLSSPTNEQKGLPDQRFGAEKVESAPQANVSHLLDRNLEEMADSLSRLKGLGLGLSEEIETQNEMLEGIMVKTDKADMSLMKQNKDMKKILKK